MKEKKFYDTKYGLKLSELELDETPAFPDYDECIVNLSNSILNHYGVSPEKRTLPQADSILAHNKKHVVVILLDGLGTDVLEKHLYFKDFLRRNLVADYSSVFPPTTVASTTSFLTGKYPIEHGWLGWDVYFEQEDKTVTCFFNTLQATEEPAADYNIPHKYFPYETIIDKINAAGQAKAYAVMPFPSFGNPGYSDLDDWAEAIRIHCHEKERNFVYAYWENPDHDLHLKGTKSNDVNKIIQELNEKMLYLGESCPDTTFIITADHGHIDIRNEILANDYPELCKMLVRRPSIEKRAMSLYVKPEYMETFPKEFVKNFGKDYILFTKEEAINSNLFGPGRAHENLTGIGDYVAVSYTNRTLVWDENDHIFRSHHAGLNRKELRIPLICYEKKNRHTFLKVYYGIIALIIVTLIMAIV